MSPSLIEKRSGPLIQKAKETRDSKDRSLVFCEGEKLIEELLKSHWVPTAFYCRPDTKTKAQKMLGHYHKNATPLYVVTEPVMNFISDLESPPGLIALAKRPKGSLHDSLVTATPLVLLLHGLQLPQNVGALLRSAEAAGVTEVWLTKGTADAYSPKALRGSTGCAFRLAIKQDIDFPEALEHLSNRGVKIVAADQKATRSYDQVDWIQPVALVVGAEGPGFRATDLTAVHESVRIPMRGEVESLNVGVAAAVCLFEAARQRRQSEASS